MRKKKDTRQLLIESAEFSTSIKLSKELVESLQMSKGKTDTLIVKNIPCTILNRENQNNRIYSTEVVQLALNEAKQLNKFEQKQLLSQADEHPESSFIPPSHASHVVINAYIKPNVKLIVEGKKESHDVLFMDWEVLNTQEGKNLRALFEAGVSIGVSIRGVGDLNGKYVENYEILGCDCVGQPSSSTYTNMPVSESIQYDINKKKALEETFNVTTSSTNVVRDLERAAEIQAQLENIGYGTVTKTSTKVDDETDPKTGARTSITTLEAETSDDVSDLNQALAMAKNAMLNGVVNVDSITIENIKDEDAKESVEEAGEYVSEKDLTEEALRVSLDYKSSAYGYDVSLKGSPENLRYIKKNLPQPLSGTYTTSGPYDTENPDVKVLEFVYPLSEDELNNLLNTLQRSMHVRIVESLMTEAKEEDPNTGKKFVLKTPAGFVAMDGNALVFKDSPEEALHFIVGKEESGLVHLSGVEKILDTMGVYDVEKYYRKDITDISAPDENNTENTQEAQEPQQEGLIGGVIGGIAGGALGSAVGGPMSTLGGAAAGYSLGSEVGDDLSEDKTNEATLQEDNGSNTRYSAEVTIQNGAAGESKEVVPVSGVKMNAIIAEVGNLYKMKADNNDGNVFITVIDTTNNQRFQYNPETNKLDPVQQPQQQVPQQEAIGDEIKQNGNKLSMELDDKSDISVEKEFDSPIQASVVKAGLERGKLPGDIMMTEEDKQEPRYEDIEPGWYVGAQGVGVTGPYESKEEAMSGLEDVADLVSVEYISPEDLNEVLYSNPDEASDPYVNKPLEDSMQEADEKDEESSENKTEQEPASAENGNESVKVTLSNIDWDINSIDSATDDTNFQSTIENLPDELVVEISADELDSQEDVDKIRELMLNAANTQTGLVINNATIKSIE